MIFFLILFSRILQAITISEMMVWLERNCLILSGVNFQFQMFELLTSSVSSFVRKTTEKIGTLHVSPDSRGKPEAKDDEQQQEASVNLVASPQEERE